MITSSIHGNSQLKPGENLLYSDIVSDIQNNFCSKHVLPMFCKKKSFWQRFTCTWGGPVKMSNVIYGWFLTWARVIAEMRFLTKLLLQTFLGFKIRLKNDAKLKANKSQDVFNKAIIVFQLITLGWKVDNHWFRWLFLKMGQFENTFLDLVAFNTVSN